VTAVKSIDVVNVEAWHMAANSIKKKSSYQGEETQTSQKCTTLVKFGPLNQIMDTPLETRETEVGK